MAIDALAGAVGDTSAKVREQVANLLLVVRGYLMLIDITLLVVKTPFPS